MTHAAEAALNSFDKLLDLAVINLV